MSAVKTLYRQKGLKGSTESLELENTGLCEGPKNLCRPRCTDLSRAAFHRDGFQEVVEGHGIVLPIQILH